MPLAFHLSRCGHARCATFRPLRRYKRNASTPTLGIGVRSALQPMSTLAPTSAPPSSPESIDAELPLVSVVIPCLNEAENIEACVTAALEAIVRMGVHGEVVVADNNSEDDSARLAERRGRARRRRAQARLRQRLPGGLRRVARSLHRDGRRRPDVRLQGDPALRRRAGGGRRAGDRRPHGQHPAGRDAVAAPLHRQPDPDGAAEPVLPHRHQRRALRHARAAPRRAAAPGSAHDRHGVRLRDGHPRLQGEPQDRGVPDRIPPARRREQAVELPRRLAPSALPARAQPQPPVHRPRRAARRPRHDHRRGGRRGRGLLRARVGGARADRRRAADDRRHAGARAGPVRARVRHLLHGREGPVVRPHARALSPRARPAARRRCSCSSAWSWAA